MQQVFILNGERLEVEVEHMQVDASLADITPVGGRWAEYTATGHRRLELRGITSDGEEIDGIFRIVSQPEEGVLEIEPWSDLLPIGEGG